MKKAAQATPNKSLASERLKYRWSQKEVAAMLGTTRINVSRWECGITAPSPYFRQRLVQLFAKSKEELGLSSKEELGLSSKEEFPLEKRSQDQERKTRELVNDVPSRLSQETPVVFREGVSVATIAPLPVVSAPRPRTDERGVSPLGSISPHTKFPSSVRHRLPVHLRISLVCSLLSLALSLFALFSSSDALSSSMIAFYVTMPKQQQQASQEALLEKHYFQSLAIGLSDGSFIFDTYAGRADVSLKEQAAAQLLNGNTSRAVNLMTQAVSLDATDGEAQIYSENMQVVQRGSPYLTVVLGLAIDGKKSDLLRARAILQSAFLLQHEVNSRSQFPGGLRLRLLIDNSGSNDANVEIAAQLVANRVTNGNADHIVGVIGWPSSVQTTNALSRITGVHLPLISQTASSVMLSGINLYFFRVNPPDSQQGSALGVEAANYLHAKNILLLVDPIDPYSVSLTNAFYDRVTASTAHIVDTVVPSTFSEGKTTVQEYLNKVIPIVMREHVDLLFLAGLDTDAVRLAHAVGLAMEKYPASKEALANLVILSGNATATTLILGEGDGPDAVLAQQFPQDMRHLIFSSFATSGEWSFEHIPYEKQPAFFLDWYRTYDSATKNAAYLREIDDNAILTYDALQMIVKAIPLVDGTVSGESLRTALLSFGHGHTPAFQGVGGPIVFDNRGDPINKTLVIFRVEGVGKTNSMVLQQVIGSVLS